MLTHLPMEIWSLHLAYIRCIHVERFLYWMPQLTWRVDVLWWLSKATWTWTLNYSSQMSRMAHARWLATNSGVIYYDLDTFLLSSFIKELGMHEKEKLEEPITASVGEQRVFTYLQQFIGHMKIEEVQKFLRFVTGSSVCISQSIKVTFNSLSGLARRPISHTCTSTLELSPSYVSYLDFSTEFSSVLSQEDFCWKKDSM